MFVFWRCENCRGCYATDLSQDYEEALRCYSCDLEPALFAHHKVLDLPFNIGGKLPDRLSIDLDIAQHEFSVTSYHIFALRWNEQAASPHYVSLRPGQPLLQDLCPLEFLEPYEIYVLAMGEDTMDFASSAQTAIAMAQNSAYFEDLGHVFGKTISLSLLA